MNAMNAMRPAHPGEVLREELDTHGVSANALVKALSVPVKGLKYRIGTRSDYLEQQA